MKVHGKARTSIWANAATHSVSIIDQTLLPFEVGSLVQEDPLLVDLVNGDYHLSPGSPATCTVVRAGRCSPNMRA